MTGQSLGLIETVGLAAAIAAADAAVKSANVSLVGYELTKGGGLVTVKLEGEVGAINAAVAAAIVAAGKIGQVYGHRVIARTAQHIAGLVHSAETIGPALAQEAPATPANDKIPVVNVEPDTAISCLDSEEPAPQSTAPEAPPAVEPPATEPEPDGTKKNSRSAAKKGGNK
ncbi:hypothetical protein GCM10023078_18270 [Gibbsiella greigii]